MAAPSPTIDPRTNANAWMQFRLGGLYSPGTIIRGGVRGFKREVAWDKKRGKGAQGATLTTKGVPPIEGTFTLQLISGFSVINGAADTGYSLDFSDWDIFVNSVLAFDPTKQAAQGLNVFYPGFSSIGLTQVVVGYWTTPEHQGKGLYHVTVQLLEWQPPPPVSAAKTVSTSKADLAALVFSPVEDNRVTDARDERDAAAKAAAKHAAQPGASKGS